MTKTNKSDKIKEISEIKPQIVLSAATHEGTTVSNPFQSLDIRPIGQRGKEMRI